MYIYYFNTCFYIYTTGTCADTRVFSEDEDGSQTPLLDLLFDLFPPWKARPGGSEQCGSGSWRDALALGGCARHPPPTPHPHPRFLTPQTGVGMGRRALANGLFNNASCALAAPPAPASCEENLPHYPASITHPRGSTELKEIFYDPTLRYVLLKAEHRPPLPHSSDQRLCWFFSPFPLKLFLLSLLFPKHPTAWVGCKGGPGSPGRGGKEATG